MRNSVSVRFPRIKLQDDAGDLIGEFNSVRDAISAVSDSASGTYSLVRDNARLYIRPTPDRTPGLNLIEEEAATMQPGEWRNLKDKTFWPGKNHDLSFKGFQTVYWPDGRAITDGMGWTQDIALHNGRLIMLLMRSNYPDLMVMEPDGHFWRKNHIDGVLGGGRRPFNRLAYDDEFLYYFPGAVEKLQIGMAVRTPLDNPGEFEVAIPAGFDFVDQDSSGNFAVTYVKEWGRFYSFAQYGYIRSIAIGETEWTIHGQAPVDDFGVRASGYAGAIVYNPVRDELVAFGGQYFGNNPPCDHKAVRMTEPFGEISALPDLENEQGDRLSFRSNMAKLFIDPRDGAYLMQPVGPEHLIYRNDDFSKPWTLYEDMRAIGGPLSHWETYAPLALIPNTDVYVFLSNINGLVLHRLKDLP